ncbi:DoxX family protein [Euzebyella saccharophila]|uniref:DoxX family protein n=1 Tax=Euzebyella saccharophila TaxID=679664 RepID=A0ABV8JRM8_9FLAO|nr:DoxX family protein [Euzebyella saccharophila]
MGNLAFWITTGFLSLFLVLSSYSYVFSPNTIEGIRDLGFPDYFRWQLAILKLAAALIILLPNLPWTLKEWGYAGISFFIITALVAHVAHKDSVQISISLIILLLTTIASYVLAKGLL